VWCVLLGSQHGDAVVFEALHRDLYNAQWLVHEAIKAWPGSELQAQLDAIGCTLNAPASP
jgi:hypothetical protein